MSHVHDNLQFVLTPVLVISMALLPVGPATGQETSTTQDKRAPPSKPSRPQLKPPAGSQRRAEREDMVKHQIEAGHPWRQAVINGTVLEAMRAVPRHVFVPADVRRHAYQDSPLPIGHGQTISQPYIVALMTELLELKADSRVLEIGTGSGYQAAVLAHLTARVYTIEIIQPLAERAAETLREQGYTDVHTRCADGYFGWKEEAPFDAIIVTCAAGHLPPPLWDQLKPGGHIIVPIGSPHEVQRLVKLTKTESGQRRSKTITSVRFVPLTRADDDQQENDSK